MRLLEKLGDYRGIVKLNPESASFSCICKTFEVCWKLRVILNIFVINNLLLNTIPYCIHNKVHHNILV